MAKNITSENVLPSKSRENISLTKAMSGINIFKAHWQSDRNLGYEIEQFIPIRLSSYVEIAVRGAILELIDSGGEFAAGGIKLFGEQGARTVTNAFAAIHQKQMTLGDIVCRVVSTNSVAEILSGLSAIYGDDFKNDLASAEDRTKVELDGEPKLPIISDLPATFRTLDRMLQIRHVIVHECPFIPPYEDDEIEKFFIAAPEFVNALWWTIARKLQGNFPLKQQDINNEVENQYIEVDAKLTELIKLILAKGHSAPLIKSQELWTAFIEHEVLLITGQIEEGWHGTAAAMDYYGAKASLTHQRLVDLTQRYQYLLAKSVGRDG